MTRRKPRVYFDRKAGITKVEGNHSKHTGNEISDHVVEFKWNVASHQSWETFVELWEQRNVQN